GVDPGLVPVDSGAVDGQDDRTRLESEDGVDQEIEALVGKPCAVEDEGKGTERARTGAPTIGPFGPASETGLDNQHPSVEVRPFLRVPASERARRRDDGVR